MFGGGCVLGMGSRLRGNDGSLGAGTTDVWGWLRVGDGFPPSREWRIFGGGNGGCLGVAACWGWVPAFAGVGATDVWGWLRVGDGFPPSRERRKFGGGNDGCLPVETGGWLRVGDGFPPSRERRVGLFLRGSTSMGTTGLVAWETGFHCDRHTRGNGYPGARWGCGRGWGVWYTACVSLFVSLFPPGEPTVFSCVLTATAAASRARPPGPSTTVPEAIPEADERSASRRILGWVLGRGVRRADAPAAGPPKRTPNRLLMVLTGPPRV